MKRSQINRIIEDAIDFAGRHRFPLPPFATFTTERWAGLGHEYDEIRDNKLGWDITDFGSGDFLREGLVMCTLRSGACRKSPAYFKRYSEKLMIVREGQLTPLHMHHEYIEDIINRGGGELCVQLYNASPEGERQETPVRISTDGRNYLAPAGTILTLAPGESISFDRHTYHCFWGKEGTGDILLCEIAMSTPIPDDSIFFEPKRRFPPVTEDEPARFLLSSEYPAARP